MGNSAMESLPVEVKEVQQTLRQIERYMRKNKELTQTQHAASERQINLLLQKVLEAPKLIEESSNQRHMIDIKEILNPDILDKIAEHIQAKKEASTPANATPAAVSVSGESSTSSNETLNEILCLMKTLSAPPNKSNEKIRSDNEETMDDIMKFVQTLSLSSSAPDTAEVPQEAAAPRKAAAPSVPPSAPPLETSNAAAFTANVPQPKPINVTYNVAKNVEFFKLQWSNYLIASGTEHKSEEVKKSTLLSLIGDECLKLYTTFELTEADQISERSLMLAIERNLVPPMNMRQSRAMFNSAKHRENEWATNYLERLRKMSLSCEYGEPLRDEMLLDKFICSLTYEVPADSGVVVPKLWMDKDMTLEKALALCKQLEVDVRKVGGKIGEPSKNTKRNNNNDKNDNSEMKTNKQYHKKNPPHKELQCWACGEIQVKGVWHSENKSICPANGQICGKCGGFNHLTTMCFKHK